MFRLDIKIPGEWKDISVERLIWAWTVLLFSKERIDEALQEIAAEFTARGLNVPPADAKTARLFLENTWKIKKASSKKERESDEPRYYS